MDKHKKNLLVFGYGLCLIFAFIGFRIYRHHAWQFSHVILFALIVIFAWMTVSRLDLLEVVYKKWMKVAGVIGHVVTTVLLSAIFYLVFGVVGIVLRVLNKDLLEEKLDKSAKSYWSKHEDNAVDIKQYTKQF